MMKVMGKAFAKKLFGANYERLPKTLLIYLIVFFGLFIADWKLQIALFIRYFMVSTLTAGMMWQALSSKDTTIEMQHMLMLPLERKKFVLSYITILGIYTVFIKTALLLVILLAVCVWKPIEILEIIICIIHAVFLTATVYSLRKYWYIGSFWVAAIVFIILFWGSHSWLILLLAINSIFSILLLQRADAYNFYQSESEKGYTIKQRKHGLFWWYLFRYLRYHKNYVINTGVMFLVALVLPYFLEEMGEFVVFVGFAILSLNTPIGILLSCDHDLEQAVRFLPRQKKAFCIPYCLFIFLCNIIVDIIFLCSWQIKNHSVTTFMMIIAIFFALQSAILSVLLEWFYPIRNWKIESDLWHHPRKYIVPVVMLLFAGLVMTWPALLFILMILLIAEILVFFFL